MFARQSLLLIRLLSQSANLVSQVGDDVRVLRDVQRHVEHVLTHLHRITSRSSSRLHRDPYTSAGHYSEAT